MGYMCDFCDKNATIEYFIVCPKCKSSIDKILKILKTEGMSEKVKVIIKDKKQNNKKVKSVSRKVKTVPINKSNLEKVKDEDRIETKKNETIKNESTLEDLSLTLCAVCEYSFLDKNKISCVEDKDPTTCGFQKK